MIYCLIVVLGIALFIAWVAWEIVHAPLIKDFPLLGLDVDDVNEDNSIKNKEAKEISK